MQTTSVDLDRLDRFINLQREFRPALQLKAVNFNRVLLLESAFGIGDILGHQPGIEFNIQSQEVCCPRTTKCLSTINSINPNTYISRKLIEFTDDIVKIAV